MTPIIPTERRGEIRRVAYSMCSPGLKRVFVQSSVLDPGFPGWLMGHHSAAVFSAFASNVIGLFVRNVMDGSKQRNPLMRIVCGLAFSTVTVKVRQSSVNDASPPQLGPSGNWLCR